LDELPRGWKRTQLGEMTEIILGQSPPSSTYNEDGKGLPFYQGKLEFGRVYPTTRKWCIAPKKVAEKGDVLISVRAPVGPTNVCPEKACIGRGLAAIRGLGGIGTFFIFYLLRSFENEIAQKGTGTTFSAIGGDQLRKLKTPLPPLNEQVRIVARLEELLVRLDAGVEGLRKVKAQLKSYRQAVLKYAFEGKLTEEWRRKNNTSIESSDMLLCRLRENRRKAWENLELSKMKRRGKLPTDDSWKAEYKEPVAPDASKLPSLPEGWTWISWNQISVWVTYGFTRPMPHVDEGIPIITGKNIVNRKIVFEHTDKTTKDAFDALSEKDRPAPEDMLITKDGTIGNAAIVPSGPKFCINQSVAAVWLRSCPINRRYLATVIESPMTQRLIQEKARGVAIQHLSITDFAKMPLPLPSLEEQEAIANEVDHQLSIIDEVTEVAEQDLALAERLRQSILKTSFEGKLVPQDPSDEPAEKLLERIREERAKSKDEKDTNKKKIKPKQLELSTYVK